MASGLPRNCWINLKRKIDMGVVFKADCVMNNRFYIEVEKVEKDCLTLGVEVVDRQENSFNRVELRKSDVGGLIKFLQKQFSKMETDGNK